MRADPGARDGVRALLSRMTDGRWAGTVTRLPDGRVLAAGGYAYSKKDTVRSADLWDPKTEIFAPAAPMGADRNFATATLMPDGTVLVAAGFSETRGTLDTAEVYHPKTNTWDPVAGRMNDHRELYTATLLKNGKVLLVGGLSLKKRTTVPTAEVYDPGADAFTATAGILMEDRFGHAAALLPDGKVLVVGGKAWRIGQADHALASAEVYDPATDAFAPTAPLKSARDRPTATTLPDSRVLVAGGTAKGSPAMMAEVYDPKTRTWADAAPLAEGRMAHDAVLLPDGRVLVAGGWADARKTTTATSEIYDPKANRWTPGPDLPFPAHDLVLVPVRGGKVLTVGGKSSAGDEKTAASIDAAAILTLHPEGS